MNTVKKGLAAAALLFVAMSGVAAADTDERIESLESLVISLAETPEQHAAIVDFYLQNAEDARAAAKRHASMALSYHGKQRENLASHCRSIAKTYDQLAQQYEKLASSHRQMGQ
jgi:3-dehydroquinate dehydratase